MVISKDDQLLYAREASYNRKTGMAHVKGEVRLETPGEVLTGEEGTFDLEHRTGEIVNGRLFLKENHYYITATRMEKLEGDTYRLENAQVTTCDGEVPDWSITGSRVQVTLEGYGTINNAAFRIRRVPVMYLPYMIFPAKSKRQTGFLPPSFGYSSLNGAIMEVPFFWAMSDRMDASFYQTYLSERGYMQGLEYRYAAPGDSKGVFLYDILDDRKEKDLSDVDDVRISPFSRTNETRYWFRGMDNQRLPLGVEARLDADYVSDQDYLREFEGDFIGLQTRPELPEVFGRPLDEKYSPIRRSALRLSRDGEAYSLQGLAAYHQRPEQSEDDRTPQPLGGLSYILLPEQVGGLPMFFNLGSEYDYIWRDVGTTGQKVSLAPTAKFPLLKGPHLELEPSFTYFLTSERFETEEGNEDVQTLHAYETGLRMQTNLQRVYDLELWNAKRVMHRIWPTITYAYRTVPADEQEELPWFEPIAAQGRLNQVAFSLENFLDARLENRAGKVFYRQWATFDLTQAYNLSQYELPNGQIQEEWAPLTAEMTLKPTRNLNFLGVAQWDHYAHQITYTDLALRLWVERAGGRRDEYTLDYLYREDLNQALRATAEFYLAHGFSLGTSLKEDFLEDETISSAYWLEYQSQCWGVRFGVEREEDQIRGIFLVRLLGFENL